jgi:hypothetical protein
MRLSSSMGVEAAALTIPPATQDSIGIIHNSRRHNQQFGKEGNPGQVQTYKVPPEALAIFFGSARDHVEQSRKISGARANE